MLTKRTALLLVYSQSRQGSSRANTLKFWPALPSASGLPPGIRLSLLLGVSAGAPILKLMLHRLEDVCSTAECTCSRHNCLVTHSQALQHLRKALYRRATCQHSCCELDLLRDFIEHHKASDGFGSDAQQ